MAFYTKDDVSKAKEIDIMSYLGSEYGWSFKSSGNGRYSCAEHDSFVIYQGGRNKDSWHWNSEDLHGNSALDFVMAYEHLSFYDAIKKLIGDNVRNYNEYKPVVRVVPSKPRVAFQLPEHDKDNKNVMAYLIKTRCIDPDIVYSMINQKKIFQDTNKNCVFVNYNKDHEICFYQKRGTSPFGKRFVQSATDYDKGGSGFYVESKSPSKKVYVYEAPIDLLSHATLNAINCVSTIKDFQSVHRVALCGAGAISALEYYLKWHKEIDQICFCLDHDEAGIRYAKKYIKRFDEEGYLCTAILPKKKDFNEELVSFMNDKDVERVGELSV